MKTCIIVMARDEEDQIQEWIDYHLNIIGFSHIFILDNNDEDNKLIITDNRVSVVPFHYDCKKIYKESGIRHTDIQLKGYNFLIPYIYDIGYEYAAFIDVDEYIVLNHKYNNISTYIQNEMIDKNIELTEIEWEIYDDNDIIWEKDCKKSIRETYTRKALYLKDKDNWAKSLLKIYPNTIFDDNWEKGSGEVHWPSYIMMDNNPYCHNHANKENIVLNHYRTQCLEKFVKHKCLNQNYSQIKDNNNNLLELYSEFNIITDEKINAYYEICKKYNYTYNE